MESGEKSFNNEGQQKPNEKGTGEKSFDVSKLRPYTKENLPKDALFLPALMRKPGPNTEYILGEEWIREEFKEGRSSFVCIKKQDGNYEIYPILGGYTETLMRGQPDSYFAGGFIFTPFNNPDYFYVLKPAKGCLISEGMKFIEKGKYFLETR